jgi:hypothetical protein
MHLSQLLLYQEAVGHWLNGSVSGPSPVPGLSLPSTPLVLPRAAHPREHHIHMQARSTCARTCAPPTRPPTHAQTYIHSVHTHRRKSSTFVRVRHIKRTQFVRWSGRAQGVTKPTNLCAFFFARRWRSQRFQEPPRSENGAAGGALLATERTQTSLNRSACSIQLPRWSTHGNARSGTHLCQLIQADSDGSSGLPPSANHACMLSKVAPFFH